jgi:hypothetical protein
MVQASPEELKQILASPTLFAVTILGIKPTRYQADLLEADKDCLVVWGRQCGKTTTLAIKALHYALTHPKREILIIAPTQRQAAIMFEKIYEYCDQNEFVKAHCAKLTQSDVLFDSGSRIHCLPAGHEGTSIRGYAASMVIFDEAAFVPEAVFMAVRPSMAVRGEVTILSGTPFGKQGYFYNQYRINELKKPQARTWETFHVRSSDSSIIDKAYLEAEKASLPASQYAQEYDAEFTAANDAYFPAQLLMTAAEDYEYMLPTAKKLPTGTKLVMGVDIARMGSDETAMCICSVTADNEYKVLWVEQHSHLTITESAGRIVELAREYPDMVNYIDETAVGGGALDIVKERNVNAVGVVFSRQQRNRMYQNLKMALEQHRVKFSANDRKMLRQFDNYSGKAASDGTFQIVKGDGHDDCVDALALCFAGVMDLEWEPFGEGLMLNPLKRYQPEPRVRWSFGQG